MSRQLIRQNRRHRIRITSFVRLFEVALPAELCGRGGIWISPVAEAGIVGSVDKEECRIELPAAIISNRARWRRSVHRHRMLVVAGDAQKKWSSRTVHAIAAWSAARSQRRPSVVGHKLRIRTAGNNGKAVVHPHQPAARRNHGFGSHRMIVGVIIAAQQRGHRRAAIRRLRQQADALLVRLPNHHARWSDVAIMATETEQNAIYFAIASGDIVRQNFHVAPAITEGKRLTIERNSIWSPRRFARAER